MFESPHPISLAKEIEHTFPICDSRKVQLCMQTNPFIRVVKEPRDIIIMPTDPLEGVENAHPPMTAWIVNERAKQIASSLTAQICQRNDRSDKDAVRQMLWFLRSLDHVTQEILGFCCTSCGKRVQKRKEEFIDVMIRIRRIKRPGQVQQSLVAVPIPTAFVGPSRPGPHRHV